MAEFAGAEALVSPLPKLDTIKPQLKQRMLVTTSRVLTFLSGERQVAKTQQRLLEHITKVQEVYGIPIELGDDFSIAERSARIRVEKLSPQEGLKAIVILQEELGKYPPDYLRSLGIKGFHLAKKVYDRSWENNVVTEKAVDGMVDPAGYVYTDFGEDTQRFRETIHHEILHVADFAAVAPLHKPIHLGKWRVLNLNESSLNLDWARKNTRSLAAYSERTAAELMKQHPTNRPRGFAEHYGSSHPREDRATISHRLFTNPHSLFMQAIHDPDLHTKIISLANMWEQRTKGRITLQYFKDLANGKIKPDPQYWTRQPIILQRPIPQTA